MKLITNEQTGHRSAIKEVFADCSEALVAVAFLKKEGASFLCKTLTPLAKLQGQARIFIGTDFYLTEPQALRTLLDFAAEHRGIDVFLGARSGATFHPKTYAGFGPSGLRCLVGSANLTGGALDANMEASLRIDAPASSTLANQIRRLGSGLENDSRFEVLSEPALEIYSAAWRAVEQARKKFEVAIAAADAGPLDLDVLGSLYRAYSQDRVAQADLATRVRNRRKARRVQLSIAALHDAELTSETRNSLRAYLQDLMSGANGGRHLWPSDNIFRKAGGGLKHPRKMIDLFRQGEEAAKLAPMEGYGILRDIAMPLPGIGINLVSEVLSTYAPQRFAVVNRNTVDALARLGLTFKGSSNLELKTIAPVRYAEIQGLIAIVRDRIGAGDFPTTDAFLNWIFQKQNRR